ncbi:1833_t:CDS:1, partial [Funneliformis geosporum]
TSFSSLNHFIISHNSRRGRFTVEKETKIIDFLKIHSYLSPDLISAQCIVWEAASQYDTIM